VISILCLHPELIWFCPHSKLLITLHSSQKQHSRHCFATHCLSHYIKYGLFVTFCVTPSIHSHLFPFILIHFHSSFYSFPFPVHSLVTDSYILVLVPSGLLFYALALVHVMCPSSRLFCISLVCDRYIVASLFWLCTLLVLYFCIFPVVLFDSLFRQLYSLLDSLVWDQLEHAPFFQSLVPPFPFHLEFAPSSSLLLPGCCSSL